MHRQIVNDFRSEDRPIGEVLDEYLSKTDALMSSTPEGRAFEGAFTLLRNDSLLADLKNDLETILLHPFALELSATERRALMGTVGLIRKGIDDVLTQRNGLTTTLREHIVNHDVVKDRELERLLREINKELATWMQTAGPRSTVTAELMPGTLEVEHLRERFYDPARHRSPPALEDVSDYAPEPPSLDELRQQGGPRLGEMRDALVSAFVRGGAASVGDAFNELAASMRRPVEILGMLQIATQVDAVHRADQVDAAHRADTVEMFETVRPDGSRRFFEVPRIMLNDDKTAALSALNYGPDDD